jgi:hypothetical protein
MNVLKFSLGSIIFLSVVNRFLISFKKVNDLKIMSPSFNSKIKHKDDLRWNNSDYVLLSKLDYPNILKDDKTDQLVYLNHPYDDKQVVRYLVGMPGDWVKSKDSEVFNRIPDGHCWVECLNGNDDSNTWGPV